MPAFVSDKGKESAVLVLPEASPRVVQAILRHGSPMQGLIGRRLGRLTQDSLATNSRGPARAITQISVAPPRPRPSAAGRLPLRRASARMLVSVFWHILTRDGTGFFGAPVYVRVA